MFNFLLRIVWPFRFLIRLLLLTLIPGVPVAYMIFRHSAEFLAGLKLFSSALGYFGGMLFLLAAPISLMSGSRCRLHLLSFAPRALGLKLRRGVLPRFYIDKDKVRDGSLNEALDPWHPVLFRILIAYGALF
jgi:hypothetical protein